MIFLGVDAGCQYGFIGFVFVDVLQFLLHQPCRRIEPLHDDARLGKQQVPRVPEADVGLLVCHYRPVVFLQVCVRHHDVMHPAERGDFPRIMYQDAPVCQPFFPVPADDGTYPPDSDKALDAAAESSYQVNAYHCFLPSEPGNRFRGFCSCTKFSQHQQAFQVRYGLVQCRRFADGNLYRRQEARQDQYAKQCQPVEPMKRFLAQQYLIKKVEQSQADRCFQYIDKK